MRAHGAERTSADELARSQQRLRHLYEVGKLLLRFQTVDETVPKVVALVSETVPLRSALFVQATEPPLIMAFQAEGEEPEVLREAKLHAQASYGFLVAGGVELDHGQGVMHALPRQPRAASSVRRFVLLPFIVSRSSVFGALQVQGADVLEESDLMFLSAVVDQLSAALERDTNERRLRTSQAKLAGIVGTAADAVISVDASMRIVLFNEGAERIFGWSARQALGKPIELLLPERFADAHRRHMGDFHASGEMSRKMGARLPEIFGRRKNGEEFHADAAISKLVVEGNTLFTVILRDISAQKRIEQEQTFLAEVSAVLGASLEHEQTLANVAQLAMRWLGDFCVVEFVDERGALSRMEVISSDSAKAELARKLREFPLDRARPPLSSLVLHGNRPQLVEEWTSEGLKSIAQDATHLMLFEAMGLRAVMGVPLMVGDRSLGALIVASCRTGHHYGPDDLHLLQKIGERAALAFESARLYRIAQRAVQARDDVLGVVAHDLRNPLGNILMQATLLRRREGGPDRRSQKPGQVIERAAQRMNRLIQDLLDVTSMDAGQLSIQRAQVAVPQALFEIADNQRPSLASRSLGLELDPVADELQVWADRGRLQQVLENLIGNAAKFTPSGGRIRIGARQREHDALFWVADTGAGIAAEDVPHLFDRFWQAKKAERRGAGLGLAIVKGLVEAHGGCIWVESKLGLGSTFYFTIAEWRPPERATTS
jgi:PAS domain S-box-containing protein